MTVYSVFSFIHNVQVGFTSRVLEFQSVSRRSVTLHTAFVCAGEQTNLPPTRLFDNSIHNRTIGNLLFILNCTIYSAHMQFSRVPSHQCPVFHRGSHKPLHHATPVLTLVIAQTSRAAHSPVGYIASRGMPQPAVLLEILRLSCESSTQVVTPPPLICGLIRPSPN